MSLASANNYLIWTVLGHGLSFRGVFQDSLSLSKKLSDLKKERVGGDRAKKKKKKKRKSIRCPSAIFLSTETDKQTAAWHRLITQWCSLIWALSASYRPLHHLVASTVLIEQFLLLLPLIRAALLFSFLLSFLIKITNFYPVSYISNFMWMHLLIMYFTFYWNVWTSWTFKLMNISMLALWLRVCYCTKLALAFSSKHWRASQSS